MGFNSAFKGLNKIHDNLGLASVNCLQYIVFKFAYRITNSEL